MRLKCLILGHDYQIISQEKSTYEKQELARHEYDELRVYKCKRCGKEIVQEEHYQ